ncbi:MAG: helix-turn-helix domain-containing protein [Pyrinomonadaceae bacterium]
MAETLGENLRAAREERGVSISEVAEQTRIAPMYIECIENDNYKPLPGGIFNKGFVKSYARFIGYDEQQALQEYSRLVSQAEGAQDEHLRAYRPEVLTDDRASPSTIPTIIFAGIILALMTGGVLFLVSYLQSQPAAPGATNTGTANQAAQQTPQTQEPVNPGNVPTMQNLKVEFRTATEPISLSATSDGKNSVNTVTPFAPQIFEPRENLKLSYSKSLAQSAQLLINGKRITLPEQPANPKRIPIEIEINASNLAQIWNSGAISFESASNAVATPTASPVAGVSASNSQTPRPATPSPSPRTSPAAANTPRRSPTPIIAGGNRNAGARPSPN